MAAAAHRKAFLIFDPEILEVGKATLREKHREKHKLTDALIEGKMRFDFNYFREHVCNRQAAVQ